MEHTDNLSCLTNQRNKKTVGKIKVISSARERAFRRKENGKLPTKPKNKKKYAQRGCRIIKPMYI